MHKSYNNIQSAHSYGLEPDVIAKLKAISQYAFLITTSGQNKFPDHNRATRIREIVHSILLKNNHA